MRDVLHGLFTRNGIMTGSSKNITTQPLIMFLYCTTGVSIFDMGPAATTRSCMKRLKATCHACTM